MSLFLFSTWVTLNTLIINIAMKIGWNHDPGYIAPALLVLLFNITLALYLSAKR